MHLTLVALETLRVGGAAYLGRKGRELSAKNMLFNYATSVFFFQPNRRWRGRYQIQFELPHRWGNREIVF